ncbi:uncharacterized protein DNG_05333 [Cephalotrichum gorgonifer]|uniref:Uncharacterized protein n=1 Tax=Cephalotrichum gorgonifer TaxID=2041049 RepID=A0AAE8MY71_9PEZI|nr:uncharacterized protein DNG_05333 [Cephalotrichum gorgonifer]
MPQDPNLYGQRPAKKQKKDSGSLGSLDFTAQMTALISNPASSSAAPRGRRRGEQKETVFRPGGKGAGSRDEGRGKRSGGLRLKEGQTTQEEVAELERSRRKMEEKARIYSALKRGDYVPKENEPTPLVDFDRKWAEANDGDDARDGAESDSEEEEGRGDDDEIIEFEDEYGRTRQGTRADKERLDRRRRRGLLGAEELERMSARPAAPQGLIYGDTIQTMAFAPDDADKMEELARKRDRSQTPPEMKHYDADAEIRDKGVGFYKFSKDEETRRAEMESLRKERLATEARRSEREEKKAARQREIQERRGAIEARRAKKMADSFLDVLAADL